MSTTETLASPDSNGVWHLMLTGTVGQEQVFEG